MILSCNNINKSFVTADVLKNVSFHVEANDKVAIVGMNGAGKSTLLKIIMGIIPADSGEVTIPKETTIGYLAQHQGLNSSNTIYQEVLEVKKNIIQMEQQLRVMEEQMNHTSNSDLEKLLNQYTKLSHEFELLNGYAYKSEVNGVLKGLGFTETDYDKKVATLSGGQKTRVALAKLLLSSPNIIMLDEPTNHLDISSVSWLETFLMNYKGCVIIVSHDRYFLDKIVNKVFEVENGHVNGFLGNYTDYAKKKALLRDAEMKAYVKQQLEIKHQEAVITKLKSFNREKSIKRAESREKMLDKIDILEKPTELKDAMHITLSPRIMSGNDVLSVKNLSKSFSEKTLFKDLNFEIKRGEKVALIGDNGTGKTTILKIINQIISADNGSITLGSNVTIGYYDQEHNVLHSEKTLFDEISDEYPTLTNTEIRNVLAAFLFTNDDVFKRISDLSGGERGRVSLAKLMLSEANFLILDEPTNHLDMTSKEILENALNHYTGTVFYVSHDRYFINATATRILELKNKQIISYIGNYDYYLEKVDELTKAYSTSTISQEDSKNPNNSVSDTKLDWKSQKEEQAKLRKKKNQLQKIEDEITRLEEENTELETQMSLPEIATDIGKLTPLVKQKEANDLILTDLYEKWEELS